MIKLKLNWRLTLFTLIFAPLLASLGLWQLSRAEEKQALLKSWEQQQQVPAVELDSLDQKVFVKHQKLRLDAMLDDERYWLLEARIYRGQPGYEVFMPAKLASGEWFLINRGWLKAHPDRRILPEVTTSSTTQTFWGEVRLPTETALVDEHDNPVRTWPHRVLAVDLQLMSQQLGRPLSPLILALDEDHPSAFIVQSKPVNMPPSKHRGYATQWFAMTAVLLVLWLITNTNLASLIQRWFKQSRNE